jgi:predicted acylesterase/phospholipase RssA
LLIVLLAACASVPEHRPAPPEQAGRLDVPGFTDIRYWGDEVPEWIHRWLEEPGEQLEKELPGLYGVPHAYLTISGGGANGAFGAGLLKGWTAAGDRPDFTMVTGISTGALIAPFAFLGAEYDHVLEEAYTQYSTDDLTNPRNPVNTFTSDAAANTEGLARLIASYFGDEVIADIADEARRGRGLLIGTTNMDVARPVIWRIGEIARSGHPEAARLIRSVILASASIPVAFPPVSIDVVAADGTRYTELHADGGVTWQVFAYPASLDFRQLLDKLRVPGTPRLFVIRNARMHPSETAIKRKIVPIASRSVSSLIRTQGIGDLYRLHSLAERDGVDFNIAVIPDDFDVVPKEAFDREYMRALFDRGFEMGRAGYPWVKRPEDLMPLLEE